MGNQAGNAGNQDVNDGDGGNGGANAGNRDTNVGNQGDNFRIGVEIMNKNM